MPTPIAAQEDEMTEIERAKLDDLHRFFFDPVGPKQPSRAEEIDQVLTAFRTGKFGMRAFLWLCAVVAAVGTAWTQLKGFGR